MVGGDCEECADRVDCRPRHVPGSLDLHDGNFDVPRRDQIILAVLVSDEVRRKCRDLSWQIADMLRAADEVEHLGRHARITIEGTSRW